MIYRFTGMGFEISTHFLNKDFVKHTDLINAVDNYGVGWRLLTKDECKFINTFNPANKDWKPRKEGDILYIPGTIYMSGGGILYYAFNKPSSNTTMPQLGSSHTLIIRKIP